MPDFPYCPHCGNVNRADLGPVTGMCLDGRACRRRQAGLELANPDGGTESPNGTRYCSHCGFSTCSGANGGLCPRWPAAAPMDLVPVDQETREEEILAEAIYRGLGGTDA